MISTISLRLTRHAECGWWRGRWNNKSVSIHRVVCPVEDVVMISIRGRGYQIRWIAAAHGTFSTRRKVSTFIFCTESL